jgi:hypothetical protein
MVPSSKCVTKSLGLFLFMAGFASSGCFLSPIPDTRQANDFARDLEPKCRGVVDPNLSIEFVKPEYVYVTTGTIYRQPRLVGAQIHLQPAPGLSKEMIQRSLECHEASVTLGKSAPAEDDPYFLPGVWLNINADSEGDGFVVRVVTDKFDDAKSVLARAKHAAAAASKSKT